MANCGCLVDAGNDIETKNLRILEVSGGGGVGCQHMGPVTNVVTQVANHISELGAQTFVLDSMNNEARPSLNPQVSLLEVDTSSVESRPFEIQQRAALAFPKWVSRTNLLRKIDIVHVHHAGMVAGFRHITNCPIVFTCHTPGFWLEPEQYNSLKGKLKFARLKWQEHFGVNDLYAIRNADITIGLGSHLSKGVMQLSPRINAENKITVIPNGVNIEDVLVLEQARARELLDATPNQFRIVCVGRITRIKGIHILLKSLQRIKEQLNDFVLDIIGPVQDEEYYTELKELAKGLNVHFNGFVSNKSDQFRQIVCAADVSLVPSLNDNQPTVILESLAFGLPVIASNVGAIPEMLTGEFGQIVQKGNVDALAKAILELHQRRAVDPELPTKTRRFVEQKFSWDSCARQHVDVFKSLLD